MVYEAILGRKSRNAIWIETFAIKKIERCNENYAFFLHGGVRHSCDVMTHL
ncbi:protein of unknown function [Burkholderia multivorans]